ncbi:AraC family transcriptional regulator [Aquimarina sp. AD1]|nr:AraC family transcriptional regulator [Aquimarina sp. AD1]
MFVSLFIAFYLLTVRTKTKVSNYLFSIFLILIAIDTSGIIFEKINSKSYNLIIFRSTFSFLQIPVLYLYIKSVCYSDFKLKPKHLIHCAPFVLGNLLFFPRFYLVDTVDKINFLQQYKYMFEIQLNHVIFHLQFIYYIIIIFLTLRKVKKIYLENYSGVSIKTYDWLFKFTATLSFIYIIALLKNIIKFSQFDIVSTYFKIGIHLLIFLLICWYLYKALNNPELFKQIDSTLKLIKNSIPQQQPNKEVLIHEQENIEKLRNYMKEQQSFLNPSLTIQNVSDEIEIPVKELSLLINHKLNQHFYDFVNSYRINYAKNLLSDSTQNKRTVLEILYDSGFNSKSSFNTAFKKETGTTPTSYRKNLIINT